MALLTFSHSWLKGPKCPAWARDNSRGFPAMDDGEAEACFEQFGKHQTGASRITVSILYLFITTVLFWDFTGDFPERLGMETMKLKLKQSKT